MSTPPRHVAGTGTGVLVHRLSESDWPAVARLEARVYAPLGLSEGEEALASRARWSPETCYVARVARGEGNTHGEGDAHGEGNTHGEGERDVAGYLIALPYPPSHSPDLAREEAAAFRSSNLHLHDLAVAVPYRGSGVARRLLRRLTATARLAGYERISLIAVAGSAPFWSAQGYRPHRDVPLPDSYGTDATYMSVAVPGRRRG